MNRRPSRVPFAFPVRALVALAWVAAAGTTGCNGCDEEFRPVESRIQVTPAEIVFGNIPVGAASEQVVDVKNAGLAVLTVSAVKVTLNDAEITVARLFTTDCEGEPRESESTVLQAGECARFAVRVSPTEAHLVTGEITIESDASNEQSLKIPVKGDGTVPGIRVCVVNESGEVDPANCTDWSGETPKIPELDFGPVPLTDQVTRLVRVFNDGAGPLAIEGADIEAEGMDFQLVGGRFNGRVDSQQVHDFGILAQPEADGARTAFLVIPSNDPLHPEVKLPLKAEGKGPRLCVEPEEGLDFGNVMVGQTRTLPVTFKNCGYVPYKISKFEFSEDDRTAVEFTTAQMPTGIPLDFAPGAEFKVDVSYKPTRVHQSADVGDVARFSIITEYQRGTIPVVGRGASPGCDGAKPVAKVKVLFGTTDISSNPQREPLDTVTLDAAGSTVRAGATPTYAWRLVRQPPNGNIGLTNVTNQPAKKKLFLELAGEYEVELIVKDQFGCQSDPKTVVVKALPKGKVHIQLTWPESFGDVDLHYIGPGGRFYDDPFFGLGGDAYWSHKTPDWGLNNTVRADRNRTNDPTLDIDDLWGNGPENVNHNLPFDGTYKIVVHYYCSRQRANGNSLGAANPVLKVFKNGVKEVEVSKRLTQRDMWEAAVVTVSGGGTNITVAPGTAPVTKSPTGVEQSCTDAPN